jgi:hypothetical protein
MTVTLPDAYWKFDESSGNAADTTAGGNTLTNTSVTYTSGALNNCADFSPASSSFTAADNTVFDASTSFSISFWFNLTNAIGLLEKAFFVKAGNTTAYVLLMEFYDKEVYLFLSDNAASPSTNFEEYDTANTINPSLSTWHHCAVTMNVASGTGTVYVDNTSYALTRRGAHTVTALANSTGNLYIGQNGGGIRYFGEKADELGFWKNYILTSGEVASLYNSGTPLPYASFQPSGTKSLATLGVG